MVNRWGKTGFFCKFLAALAASNLYQKDKKTKKENDKKRAKNTRQRPKREFNILMSGHFALLQCFSNLESKLSLALQHLHIATVKPLFCSSFTGRRPHFSSIGACQRRSSNASCILHYCITFIEPVIHTLKMLKMHTMCLRQKILPKQENYWNFRRIDPVVCTLKMSLTGSKCIT